jgi:glucose-1-phosphate cytidylyltransferase
MKPKVVILAGGLGTRIMEESEIRPKPMIEIGGRPIIWHIMKIYSTFGLNDFIVCLGYKGYVLKEFFANYNLHMSDITFDIGNNTSTVHSVRAEPWKVSLIDTGIQSMTGGRLKRIKEFLGSDTFCMTYGDGLADINLDNLLAFHNSHGRLATITAVQPSGRFGALNIANGVVRKFIEKPLGDGSWINGGFFVLSRRVLDYIEGDETVWEKGPMERLAREGQLMAYEHNGFWYAMDTLRDKRHLEELWASGRAPWHIW